MTLSLHTSVSSRGSRMAAGVVIRDAEGHTLRVIAKSLDAASRQEATYRGLLHGLWRARGMGARRIRVYCDDADVIAHLEAGGHVPEELVGLYLQTKAMLNAYRWSTIEFVERDRNAEAALAAVDALEQEPDPQGLQIEETSPMPLWDQAGRERVGSRR